MTDPRTAALAEALFKYTGEPWSEEDATAILAALDAAGYTLARKPQLEGVAWVPIEGDALARLRRIEEAAREWDAAYEAWADRPTVATLKRANAAGAAFRAALEADK